MNSATHRFHHPFADLSNRQDTDLPQSFEASVERVIQEVLTSFKQEILQQQLYYHGLHHVMAVQRRAAHIFEVLRPYWPNGGDSAAQMDRLAHLLNLCAIAHDWVQEFLPQTEPHTPRRRESGVSERATVEKLQATIDGVNQQIQARCSDSAALFQPEERLLIQEAITATICAYDPAEQAIFQPDLYNQDAPVSFLTRILALADIGSLTMEGVESYNREGSLLFLEENPDLIPLLQSGEIDRLPQTAPSLAEIWKQRLLRRTRFQVQFARSRFARTQLELAAFPQAAIAPLTQTAFSYLRPEVLAELEATTPIDEDTSLETLLDFFQFSKLV